jgi:hypothetical protein
MFRLTERSSRLKEVMDWKPKDWIEHPKFGVGRVSEVRENKLDIDFVREGRITLQQSPELKLKPATPPSTDFRFPHNKRKRHTPQFKVKRPPSRPPLDFDHLVECFLRCFDGGFDSDDFQQREREYKEDAAQLLKHDLSKKRFAALLRNREYAGVCDIAKDVLTNLVDKWEKMRFRDAAFGNVANRKRFANALFDLLYGPSEMEARFTKFSDLLSEMGVNKWPMATYYQFLASDGRWMFMKPAIMKRMADSLKISLNYKPEPNWLTYSKLQELAERVELELKSRGLKPHSRIDVQGFIWTSIQIEEGKYGTSE